jgi:hypothetical protein
MDTGEDKNAWGISGINNTSITHIWERIAQRRDMTQRKQRNGAWRITHVAKMDRKRGEEGCVCVCVCVCVCSEDGTITWSSHGTP